MSEFKYLKMIENIKKSKIKCRAINLLDKLITAIIFLSYPLLLAYLFAEKSPLLFKSILVPAVAFVCVTIFRGAYNAKRPYEEMDFEPIIKKETLGKSFPSRHVFSIFMIAMTYMLVDVNTGIMICVLGIILAALRVMGGVHYIKDVVAGAAIGVICGLLELFL